MFAPLSAPSSLSNIDDERQLQRQARVRRADRVEVSVHVFVREHTGKRHEMDALMKRLKPVVEFINARRWLRTPHPTKMGFR